MSYIWQTGNLQVARFAIYSVINVLPSKWLQLNAGGGPNARPAQ